MGINRPSLYAAFGSKEDLFRRAVERYEELATQPVQAALAEATAGRVVEVLLRGMVELITRPRGPRGCLLVQAALTCNDESNDIRRELIARRGTIQKVLLERFERARREGDLSVEADTSGLARFVAALLNGLAVQAASGATRTELINVVELAVKAWYALRG